MYAMVYLLLTLTQKIQVAIFLRMLLFEFLQDSPPLLSVDIIQAEYSMWGETEDRVGLARQLIANKGGSGRR